jgi:hypothetical protein
MRKALKSMKKLLKSKVYMPFRNKEMHEVEQDRIWHIMHSLLKGDECTRSYKVA